MEEGKGKFLAVQEGSGQISNQRVDKEILLFLGL